ncbi:arsenical-resistance protein [Methylovorus sp. MM2]|uniref:ACR3 family arsenite efflux transporter n=1 Tax=Methylovorus sp. MM2 TaxID=1848038 RepID=UPI0007E15BF7|nr:ACR3 family arsenite efflux transporter [Methylovorus sp. MM2]OAM53227.1 arsenical-resistance protein [Methylovorus sp. MM2]
MGKAVNGISFFERYLTLWVLLCIVIGIGLGKVLPEIFQQLGALQVAGVNLPVAILIWLMIIPMLLKIDFNAVTNVRQHWKDIGVTLFINWAVKPFSMALFAWVFIKILFADYLPPEQIDAYIAGLIILAAAPCTAMVFVWSGLCDGDANFTLSQVALNDIIMLVAFAPIVALLLGIASITIPWDTLLISVLLYLIVPIFFSQLIKKVLMRDPLKIPRVLKAEVIQPISILALLITLILLFGFQGQQIVNQPSVIALLSIPILFQVYLNSGLAYWLNRKLGVAHCIAGPSALIGASNFFELAVATAIGIFGLNSGAALSTVVGVLVEVPVMLSVVSIINKTKQWYEAG